MKTILRFIFLASISGIFLVQCRSESNESVSPFGEMIQPKNNASSNEKIALGRKLFFDQRLSLNTVVSCATCHIPNKALSDGRKLAQGVKGRNAFRNTPSLFNVGYAPRLMFDGGVKTLEEQVLVPILDHNEMGASMPEVIMKLRNDAEYQTAARKIFNRDFDAWVLTRSIAAFERTLISDNSAFDHFFYQNKSNAISESAKRGWKLFSGKLNCVKCHSAPFFTDFKLHNNGRTTLNSSDLGRYRINNDSTDIGFFKTPSLRNVTVTAPYMHDGTLKTLDQVIQYYAKGGDGGVNQEKLKPFSLTKAEIGDLKNFLKSLEDY